MSANSEFKQQVLACLMHIPRGRVATYAQIAKAIGHPNAARAVGNILHQNQDGDLYPCYRVVNASGGLSCHYVFGGIKAQAERLKQDGIEVKDGRVDLSRYQLLELKP